MLLSFHQMDTSKTLWLIVAIFIVFQLCRESLRLHTVLEKSTESGVIALDISPTKPNTEGGVTTINGIIVNASTDPETVESLDNHLDIDPTIIPSLKDTLAFKSLLQCNYKPNKYTNHIRLPDILYNISMSTYSTLTNKTFWNPTIIALPPWARNQYLIVSMIYLENATYRQSVMCEANICHKDLAESAHSRHHHCSSDDEKNLGVNGGLRCATEPTAIVVPATTAEKCIGKYTIHGKVTGFHDPRLFYTGRGEPLLMLSSQSRYACIGLWATDLRSLYPPLEEILSSSPTRLGPGPLKSYPTLIELTRNPPSTRHAYEKNWMLFSPSPTSTYIQYELTTGRRTIAQLIGSGLTTTNLTSPTEASCLFPATASAHTNSSAPANSTWHQATPALKLLLCKRNEVHCSSRARNTVFVAIVHRKYSNALGLPERYERYFIVFAAAPPFAMLAVSEAPVLFANESVAGWEAAESWDDVRGRGRGMWARFTYTTTIAYAWNERRSDVRDLGMGYLDDEVVISVGVEDAGQVFARVKMVDLLTCMRLCPGV